MYLYIPFFCSFGGWVLFLEHRMFLRLVPEVKLVLMPAFLRDALIWWESPGMYGMQANDLRSSLVRLTLRNGSSSKSSFVLDSTIAGVSFAL